MYSHSLVK